MTPKYETINGTLCRMVEPEPLTEKSQLPCVVRLIQDDSPMGRLNRRYRSTNIEHDIKYICVSVKNYVMQTETDSVMAVEAYEILGYPVVEGSAEWALYQMMQGKWVVHEKAYPCHIHCNMVTWSNDETPPLFTVQIPSKWLSDNLLYSGWQLYEPAEPKPQPQYKVGDWVECKGNQYRISAFGGGEMMLLENAIFVLTPPYPVRKLDPSEVVVKIGCLEGTVEDLSYAVHGKFWLVGKATERYPSGMHAILYDEMLDAPTRERVESLLKAQEEK